MAFEVFKMMGTIALNREEVLKDLNIIKQETKRASTEMGRSFSKFTTDHSAQFRKVGMVAVAAGAVISLAVKKVGSSFDEYESALVDMGKITDESFESIENRMKKLPPVLGSLTDLTRGYYQIVSAGIRDPVLAIDTLTVASETAAAAHVNQSEVVKGLTKVMAGYEGKIEDVSEAADLMFAIEKEGQTTVAEMIPLIGGLASASSNLGVTQNEMGASMAVITRTAGNSAEAATMYEGVLLGLMKPTEAMTTALKGMGFATAQMAIEELGFVEVLRRLDEVTGGSAEVLGELFGRKQAIMGMTKLTTNEMNTLITAIASVADKAGMADKAFQDWTTTGDAFNKEQKAVTENLLLLIGKAIDPMMDIIQRQMIETIKTMGEWITKNEELAASIGMWSGGLGMALVPFGLLMMMLPGLVIALPAIIGFIGVLSAKFALLAINIGLSTGGLTLLLAGLTAVGLYIGNEWKKAFEEGDRIIEAQVAGIEAQGRALSKLIEAYDMTAEEVKYWNENGKLSISVLARVREETRLLIEAKYGLVEVYGDVVEAIKKAALTFEELDGAILNSIITGKELSEQQEAYIALRQRMSDVDATATQRKINDLDRECVALLANMKANLMTMEQIDEYRQVMLQHIIVESSERMEYLDNAIEMERRVFELTHTWAEMAIRDLDIKKDKLIETARSAMLSSEQEAAAIEAIIKYYNLERAALDEVIRKKDEAKNKNAELEASYKTLIDRIYELTHTALEAAIRKLDEQKQKYIELGHEKKKIIEWYNLEIAKVKELYSGLDITKEKMKETGKAAEEIGDALDEAGEKGKEAGEEVVKSWTMVGGTIQRATVSLSNFTREGVAAAIANIKMKFYPTIQSLSENIANLFGKLGVDGYRLTKYYERQIEMLTKSMYEQIRTVEYGFEVYKNTLTSLGGAYDELANSAAKSGNSMASSWNAAASAAEKVAIAVEKIATPSVWGITSDVRGFQKGGGIDSVLIRATPGEHVIDKPMVDFVKRTGAVPFQLTRSIISGRPALSPNMQRGGAIRTSVSPEIKYNIGPIYVEGDGDIGKIKRAIQQTLDESNLEILRSGSEVIPGVD